MTDAILVRIRARDGRRGRVLRGSRMKLIAALCLVVLTGCTGNAKVDSIEDSLALAATTIRALAQEAKLAYTARRISTAERDRIADALQDAQDAAQAANTALAAGDRTTALGRLQVIRALLQTVEGQLSGHRTSGDTGGRPAGGPARDGGALLAAVRGGEGAGRARGPGAWAGGRPATAR